MGLNNEVGTDKGGGGGGGPLTYGCKIGPVYQEGNGITYLISNYNGTADALCPEFFTDQWTQVSPTEWARGCCLATIAPSGGGSSTNDPNGPLGFGDLVIPDGTGGNTNNTTNPTSGCPPMSQLQMTIDGLQFLYNGQPLSEECCNKEVTGVDVVVTTIGSKKYCYVVQGNSCPPLEAISISPDQTTIIGIDSQDCCTKEVTGVNNVYWDPNTKLCKIGQQVTGCTYQEIVLQNLDVHDGPGTEQVFGVDIFGNTVSLPQECCTSGVTNYNVQWNPTLGICEKLSSTPASSVSITINETKITPSGCTDLIVSAKLFFSEPLESCSTGEIVASLLPNNPNIIVEQLGVFDSGTDGYNNWVDLGIRLIDVGNTPFDVILNISGGIVDCCNYDVRLDNIRIDCFREEDREFFFNKKCVGFDLVRVIDNKKSWVYNPGIPDVGIKINDEYVRDRGENGLIQGYGTINRTFAPSDDADIPWRYTDYYNQSNILEPHSDLVINSKELELTFNMCSSCCSNYSKCPDGYSIITTTGGTEYCSKASVSCPSGYILSAGTCYSATTTYDCDCINIEWELSGTSVSGFNYNLPYTTIIDRRLWLFDVSGVTHSLEWNNSVPAWVIYGGPSTSTAEYIYTADTQCPISTLFDWIPVGTPPLQTFSNLIISSGTCSTTIYTADTVTTTLTGDTGLYCTKTLSLLELESYKKVFQSFWVRMIEQFVPATTIFVSGERWCNNDSLICTEFNECDYDFEYVDSEITVLEYGTDYIPYTGHTTTNGGDISPDLGSSTTLSGETTGTPQDSTNGPIITDGTVVIPTPTEPGTPVTTTTTTSDGTGTSTPVTTTTSTNQSTTVTSKSPLQEQKVKNYFGSITNGGTIIIFE